MTIQDVLDKHGVTDLSAVVIDTEEFDFEVLRLIDLERLQPSLIQLEHHQLSFADQSAVVCHLAEHGYAVVRNKYDMFGLAVNLPNEFFGTIGPDRS